MFFLVWIFFCSFNQFNSCKDIFAIMFILICLCKMKLQECPLGTFKNATGSDRALCTKCPSHELPNRGIYVSVRGVVLL